MSKRLLDRKWPWVIGTIVIALALIWGNTYYRQREQYGIALQADQEGRTMEAIAAYESTLHMYTPLSSAIPAAAQRLWEIGERMEADDRLDEALIAYRSLRSSFYAVRSFYQPYPEWIPRCEGKIDELMELQEARLAASTTPSEPTPPDPSPSSSGTAPLP